MSCGFPGIFFHTMRRWFPCFVTPTPSLLHGNGEPLFSNFLSPPLPFGNDKIFFTSPTRPRTFYSDFSHATALPYFCTLLLYARLLHRRAVVVFILLSNSNFHVWKCTSFWNPPPTPHVAQSYIFFERGLLLLSPFLFLVEAFKQSLSHHQGWITCFLTPHTFFSTMFLKVETVLASSLSTTPSMRALSFFFSFMKEFSAQFSPSKIRVLLLDFFLSHAHFLHSRFGFPFLSIHPHFNVPMDCILSVFGTPLSHTPWPLCPIF